MWSQLSSHVTFGNGTQVADLVASAFTCWATLMDGSLCDVCVQDVYILRV